MSAVPVTEAIELAAGRDLFRAAPPELAARHGIEVAEVGGVTLTALRDVPSNSMFDRALGLGLESPIAEAALDAVSAWFEERDIDLFVSVAPEARPPELPEWLTRRGFEPAWAWMKFTRGVEPLPDEDGPLRVERVEADHRAVLGHVVSTAFGMPEWVAEWLGALHGRRGWSLHLACDGATPVGAAGLFVEGRAGYLTFGSVLPEHRGKGAQRALFAARIREAAALGCEMLVTETGVREPGKAAFSYANILRAGFEEQYVRPNYVRRAPRD
jgi:GNAT superfamily N-acetyltransferase